MYHTLREKINSGEKEATLKQIEEKIKSFESKNELSKTAKKKLKLLIRLKNKATGKTPTVQQKKVPGAKSVTQGSDKKKKAKEGLTLLQAAGKKGKVNLQVKSEEVKVTEKNKGKQNKQVAKKVKVQTNLAVDSDDSDDDENVEEESDEDSAPEQEVEDEESGEEDSDEDDGEEEEAGDESGDEESDEEDDDSDEDSAPQVSNKKQKKK